MKKTLLFILFIIAGCIFIAGCGRDLSAYTGTYVLEYSKYVGDPDTERNTENWTIIFNEDGTGKSNRDGASYNVEWQIDGENIVVIEKFIGTIEYNGTLKDGKLDIFNGDKTQELTLEAVFNKQ